MSRKQVFTQPTTVRLDDDTREKLESVIDKKRRSQVEGNLKGRQDILRLIIDLGMKQIEAYDE